MHNYHNFIDFRFWGADSSLLSYRLLLVWGSSSGWGLFTNSSCTTICCCDQFLKILCFSLPVFFPGLNLTKLL